MSFFENALEDSKNMQQKLIGPDYKYYKYIRTPSEMGMSGDGNLDALTKDIAGIINYVELLVTGKTRASSTGGPLGNKFFLKTGATCKDNASGENVDRYIYVNNVPSGNVPFISSGIGVNFSEFEGLIPGTIQKVGEINPFSIFSAFMTPANPPCREVQMQTIDVNNNVSSESHHITDNDLKNMDSCYFTDKKNPITGDPCREAFVARGETINGIDIDADDVFQYTMPNSGISMAFFIAIICLFFYIMYRGVTRK